MCSAPACWCTGPLNTADPALKAGLRVSLAVTRWRWRAPPALDLRERVGRVRKQRMSVPSPELKPGGAAGRSGCCCGRSRRGSSRAAARCATSCAHARPSPTRASPGCKLCSAAHASWPLHSCSHQCRTACLLLSGVTCTHCGWRDSCLWRVASCGVFPASQLPLTCKSRHLPVSLLALCAVPKCCKCGGFR